MPSRPNQAKPKAGPQAGGAAPPTEPKPEAPAAEEKQYDSYKEWALDTGVPWEEIRAEALKELLELGLHMWYEPEELKAEFARFPDELKADMAQGMLGAWLCDGLWMAGLLKNGLVTPEDLKGQLGLLPDEVKSQVLPTSSPIPVAEQTVTYHAISGEVNTTPFNAAGVQYDNDVDKCFHLSPGDSFGSCIHPLVGRKPCPFLGGNQCSCEIYVDRAAELARRSNR